MPARLLLSLKKVKEGIIIEMVVWEVSPPVVGCRHPFKYRLFCGSLENGACLVRYDNERGKGDHRHVGGEELPYVFDSLEELFADFEKDVDEVQR